MANFFPYLANDIIYQMEGHEPPKVDPILAFANDVFKEKEDKLYGFLLKHCRKEELEQLKADIYQHIINEQEGDISTDLIKKFRDRLGVTPKFLK